MVQLCDHRRTARPLSARSQPRRPVTVARRGARRREQSLFTPLRLGELMAIMAKFMIGNTPNIPSSQSGNVTLCVCRLEPRSRDSRPRPPLCHTQAAARQLYALLLRHCDREADSSLRGEMLCSASSSGMSCYNDCRNNAENYNIEWCSVL